MYNDLIEVGMYREEYNTSTGQNLPCEPIYQSSGFEKHVLKHHPKDAQYLLDNFQKVIDDPDYVGKHPNEPNSVELVKTMDRNILVGIKQDKSNYLYVSTVHTITDSKLNRRLNGGRLHKLFD